MDDSILMPPPAPRFKRPRIDGNNNNNNIIIDSNESSNAEETLSIIVKQEPEDDNDRQYQCELFCVSPDEPTPDKPDSSLFEHHPDNNIASSFDNNNSIRNDDAEMMSHRDDDVTVAQEEEQHHQHQRQPSSKTPTNSLIPDVSFRDIIGQGPAKLRLDEALLPLALPPDLAESVLTGIRSAPASILLHGPPGCGKTKLAQALAGEARAAFFNVGPSDILSKFVGESEASVRGLFREARQKARKTPSKCSVIFFDEVDALGRSRVDEGGAASQAAGDNSSRRVLAELLIQMTGLSANHEDDNDNDDDDDASVANEYEDESSLMSFKEQTVGTPTKDKSENNDKRKPRVIVVAATNRPEDCDPALLRRFAVRVLVALPTRRDRKRIIMRLLHGVHHSITECQLEVLAQSTDGWSGSDLESMTREAVMAPVRETLRAAAILKKRAGKKNQQSGDGSSEEKNSNYDTARESLLNGFRNLRPVSSRDFEDGIAFFLGDASADGAFGQGGNGSRHSHYDSSDSSDDEA